MKVAWYYGFTLDVHLSRCPSEVFSFPDDKLSKCQWIFTEFGVGPCSLVDRVDS